MLDEEAGSSSTRVKLQAFLLLVIGRVWTCQGFIFETDYLNMRGVRGALITALSGTEASIGLRKHPGSNLYSLLNVQDFVSSNGDLLATPTLSPRYGSIRYNGCALRKGRGTFFITWRGLAPGKPFLKHIRP